MEKDTGVDGRIRTGRLWHRRHHGHCPVATNAIFFRRISIFPSPISSALISTARKPTLPRPSSKFRFPERTPHEKTRSAWQMNKIELVSANAKVNYKMRDAGFSRQRFRRANQLPHCLEEPISPSRWKKRPAARTAHVRLNTVPAPMERPLANLPDWLTLDTSDFSRSEDETSTMPGCAPAAAEATSPAAHGSRTTTKHSALPARVSDYWRPGGASTPGGTGDTPWDGICCTGAVWTEKVLFDRRTDRLR